MFNRITETFYHFKTHLKEYMTPLFFFQFLKFFITLPTISFILYQLLSKANLNSLTDQTLLVVLTQPATIILLFLLIIFLFIAIFFEASYYFLLIDYQERQEVPTHLTIIRRIQKKLPYLLSPYTLLFILYFFIITPLVSVGIQPDLLKNLKLPDFIVDELLMTTKGSILYLTLMLLLTYLGFRLIYVLYLFITRETLTLKQAFQKSCHKTQHRFLKQFLLFSFTTFIYTLLVIVIVGVLLSPVLMTEILQPSLAPFLAGFSLTLIQLLLFFAVGLFQVFISIMIVKTYHPITKSPTMIQPRFNIFFKKNQWKLLLTLLLFITFSVNNTLTLKHIVYQPKTAIVAHRGFMEKGVENSIEALVGAAKSGADYAELDIQETKDGEIVVMHDTNLKRLTGHNRMVYDMTLDEIRALQLSQNNMTSRIPTLEEFIQVALKEDIKLLIEIKPHGFESEQYLTHLNELLTRYEVTESFLVQSLDLPMLNQLKKINDEIQTGYVLPLNIGNLPDTSHDFIVLEEFSVTKKLIQQAEAKKQPLFVWTVNKDDLIQKYLRWDVDGIITNHPDRAVTFRESEEETKSIVQRILYLLK